MTDERGVSPVVGVALLVGITAILASVTAVVVFGVDGPAESPDATLSFEVVGEEPTVVLIHEGGDALDPDEIVVIDESGTELAGLEGELTTGDRQEIVAPGELNGVERISVVWLDPRGDRRAVLASYEPRAIGLEG